MFLSVLNGKIAKLWAWDRINPYLPIPQIHSRLKAPTKLRLVQSHQIKLCCRSLDFLESDRSWEISFGSRFRVNLMLASIILGDVGDARHLTLYFVLQGNVILYTPVHIHIQFIQSCWTALMLLFSSTLLFTSVNSESNILPHPCHNSWICNSGLHFMSVSLTFALSYTHSSFQDFLNELDLHVVSLIINPQSSATGAASPPAGQAHSAAVTEADPFAAGETRRSSSVAK